ncbi:MAG: hypothetical protein ABEI32_13245 [Halothece sp.]
MLKIYTIMMLGPGGSGKTVFLASMYKKLATQGKLGFFLEIDSAEKRKRLQKNYTQVALEEQWPEATSLSDISKWKFSCKVQNEYLSNYPVCDFVYMDYAGVKLTDEMEQEDIIFENHLKDADALFGLLDGQKIYDLMHGGKVGQRWMINELPNLLEYMQNTENPAHFLISKWDLLESHYTLEQIKNKLLEIEEFQNVIQQRNCANSPIYLIPVSSVGMGFTELQPDGTIKKNNDQLPQPYQVEIPLACVLPDLIRRQLNEVIQEKERKIQEKMEFELNLNLWDKLQINIVRIAKFFLKPIRAVLPRKYQLTSRISQQIANLINSLEKPVKQKEKAAQKRIEDLKYKQAKSIQKLENKESALNHALNCFLSLIRDLERKYPNSKLKV